MDNRPNILLIMADQLTPFLMEVYEHPVVKTPNLDKLVKDTLTKLTRHTGTIRRFLMRPRSIVCKLDYRYYRL